MLNWHYPRRLTFSSGKEIDRFTVGSATKLLLDMAD